MGSPPGRAKHPRTTRNRVSGTEKLVLERRIWLETRFLDEIWVRMLRPYRTAYLLILMEVTKSGSSQSRIVRSRLGGGDRTGGGG